MKHDAEIRELLGGVVADALGLAGLGVDLQASNDGLLVRCHGVGFLIVLRPVG